MSRLPAPENPVLDTKSTPLAWDSLDEKAGSPVSDNPQKESKGTVLISSVNKNEPIVTRRELWAYYRELSTYYEPTGFLTIR
jgi:hypothetical protein